MILTNKQQEGLKIAIERYKQKEAYTCIGGYAGVGKSTLVRFIVEALGLDPAEDVAYITFTGKAASVLRHKGCPNAMTAHKLLYYSKRLPNGKYIFKPRHELEGDFKLIVVDEISMLPNELWILLLTHGIHIIACGDPAQLPPVSKDSDNHVLDHPHIFLDEIMRQAAESEIIRLSMDIREGKDIKYFMGNEVRVLHYTDIVPELYDWPDQIITATNNMRHEINNYVRTMHGRGNEPEAGDKVICCRNCWSITDIKGENALVNGIIGYLKEPIKIEKSYPIYNFPKVTCLSTGLEIEGEEEYEALDIDYRTIVEGQKTLTPRQEFEIYKRPDLKGTEPLEFNYGYAITCHKAQGSEWDKVLIIEEKFPFDQEEHRRWLYTAVTRAANKVILVR